MEIPRAGNESIWRGLRTLFLGSLLLFLINIYFGFDNAFTLGEIPRSQRLLHLHAGSVGWITLSAIGLAAWVLNVNRHASEGQGRRVRLLLLVAVVVFAGYIPNFYLAYSGGQGPLLALLPIFGAAAVVVLWVFAVYALSQVRRQTPTTTVHVLAAGALLAVATGATVGMLLGLERVIGQFLPLASQGEDRVCAHACMMDTYLFLVAAAIIEWFTIDGLRLRWTWPGLLQAVFWTFAAILVPIAFFTGTEEALLPLFLLLLVVGLLIFLVRVGWRAIALGPFSAWPRPWAFFGSLWLVIYMLTLLVLFSSEDGQALPPALVIIFTHSGFVGMMTNLIFGLISARAQERRDVVPWGETAALWIINLGLVAFFGLKILVDIRLGAAVMGVGVLLGVYTMGRRLWRSDGPAMAPPAMGTPMGPA